MSAITPENAEIIVKKEDEYNEKTEEQYEYEFRQIELLFPDAQFTIAIDLEDLDDVITELNTIIIKKNYSCYCHANCKRNTDWFIINGEKITNKYVIHELIKQNLVLDCNHCFVEGFHQYPKNSNCQFEICTGS